MCIFFKSSRKEEKSESKSAYKVWELKWSFHLSLQLIFFLFHLIHVFCLEGTLRRMTFALPYFFSLPIFFSSKLLERVKMRVSISIKWNWFRSDITFYNSNSKREREREKPFPRTIVGQITISVHEKKKFKSSLNLIYIIYSEPMDTEAQKTTLTRSN